jgi:hypothetical protein
MLSNSPMERSVGNEDGAVQDQAAGRHTVAGELVGACTRPAGRMLRSALSPASQAANRRGYPPRNPLPAKRIPAQIRSLCRSYTGEAVRSLAAIMRNADAPPRARIQAADILLDRGWGKPAPTPPGEDDKDIHFTIRHLAEERRKD